MIKFIFTFFVLLVLALSPVFPADVTDQTGIDSLRTAYLNAKGDSLRIITGMKFLSTMHQEAPLEIIKTGEEVLAILKNTDVFTPSVRFDKIVLCMSILSISYGAIGDNAHSIDLLLEQLRLVQKKGSPSQEPAILQNLGVAYEQQNMFSEARNYYRLALNVARSTGGTYIASLALGCIGSSYEDTFPDSALQYYKLSLEEMSKPGMADRQGAMGWMLNNIGDWYMNKGNSDSAYYYYIKSMEMRKSIDHRLGLLNINRDLAKLYQTRGDKKQALNYINNSIAIGKQNGFISQGYEAYLIRSELMEQVGNYKAALRDFKDFIMFRDSTVNERDAKNLLKQTMKYEYEKTQLRDSLEFSRKEAVLKEKTEKQRIGLLASAGVLALLLALAIAIHRGKKRSDELLLNILPAETAAELKAKGSAEARMFNQVTVMFTDFKNFTQASENLTPAELVKEIHHCYSAFDQIISKFNLEKIKTIGDSYMCAGGLPVPNATNAEDIVKAAIEINEFMNREKQNRIDAGKPFFEIRIGCHTGPVVAGIVGIKKFAYDIWGDTVNIASRMESSGEIGRVNISGNTYQLIKDKFLCTYRGNIEAKNKGKIEMYFVEGNITVTV